MTWSHGHPLEVHTHPDRLGEIHGIHGLKTISSGAQEISSAFSCRICQLPVDDLRSARSLWVKWILNDFNMGISHLSLSSTAGYPELQNVVHSTLILATFLMVERHAWPWGAALRRCRCCKAQQVSQDNWKHQRREMLKMAQGLSMVPTCFYGLWFSTHPATTIFEKWLRMSLAQFLGISNMHFQLAWPIQSSKNTPIPFQTITEKLWKTHAVLLITAHHSWRGPGH